DDHDVRAAPGEQADAHHPGNLVDGGFHALRIGDPEIVDVQDDVAIVGGGALPPYRLAAGELDQFARDQAARHRDHLDRQREPAQHIDPLGRVDDAHELPAGLGDDLLAGQGRPAALDQAVRRIALVGAIHVEL